MTTPINTLNSSSTQPAVLRQTNSTTNPPLVQPPITTARAASDGQLPHNTTLFGTVLPNMNSRETSTNAPLIGTHPGMKVGGSAVPEDTDAAVKVRTCLKLVQSTEKLQRLCSNV